MIILDGKTKECLMLLTVFLIALIASGIAPHDYADWALEVSIPVGIVLILVLTYKRFQLSRMSYWMILFHSLILLYGAHYTYAEAQLGELMKDVFGFSRNHYDRIGHIAFGFFPAVVIREIMIRKTALKKGAMLFFVVVCIVGAAAAFYEITEWWTALIVGGSTADAYLGSQGDIWDAQWDMFLAFVGVIVGQLAFMRLHAKQLLKEKLVDPYGSNWDQ